MFYVCFRTFYLSLFKSGYYCFEEVISFTNGREIPRIIACRIIVCFRNFPLTGNPFLIIVGGSLIISRIVISPDSGIKSFMRREVVMLYGIGGQVIFSKEKVVRSHTVQRFPVQKIIARSEYKASPCQQK